jgi:enhancing lycopene biosynthesis protein 2
VPGGFGAAKNLSNFAFKGAEMEINDDIVQVL